MEKFIKKIIKENFHDGRDLKYDLTATLAENTGLSKTHITQVLNKPQERGNYTTVKLISQFLEIHPRKLIDAGMGVNKITLSQAELLFKNTKYEE